MVEMLQYDFMIRAFGAGLIIAILASVTGSFIVLRRYALLTEALAHVSLVGVAVALLTGSSPLWLAVVAAMIAAWTIEYLRSYHQLYSDSILALFLSGSLALAIVIVSLSESFNTSLFSYLFGSILAVSPHDLMIMSIFGTLAMAVLLGLFKEFYFIAFDEEVAQVSGLRVRLMNFLLVSIVAVIIALSIRVVGTLLIGAMMVIPAMSALRFRLGLVRTVVLAMLFAMLSVIAGMTLSFYYSLPSGATIVLCILAIFVVSMVLTRK